MKPHIDELRDLVYGLRFENDFTDEQVEQLDNDIMEAHDDYSTLEMLYTYYETLND